MHSKPALRTLLAIAAFGAGVHALAADPPASDTLITPLLEQPLAARAAPVASMLTVEYKPGAGTPPHTHPADTFVYVLAGGMWCDGSWCDPGTHIEIPEGAAAGPYASPGNHISSTAATRSARS